MNNEYDDCFYHGLAGYLTNDNVKENIVLSLKQLDSILYSGGIYSKSLREKNNISSEGKPVLNGDDYISLCIKNVPSSEFEGINEGLDSAYNKYIINKLSIVIDSNILNSSEFRKDSVELLPGERQVKDSVLISDFKAIRVGYEFPMISEYVIGEVSSLLNKYGVNIPIIDCKDEIVKVMNR